MRYLWPVLLVVMLVGVSCTTSLSQLQTSYVPHDESRPVQVYPRLKGSACEWRLFCAFKVGGDRSVNSAIAAMTRGSAKIDNLFGVQVEESQSCFLLVSKVCTDLSAYPVVYKDANPKRQLFEANMMAGRLVKQPASPGGGTAAPAPTNTGARNTQPYKTTATPTPTAPPALLPTKKECEAKCARFAKLWSGSDAIRSTIRGQCVKKCLSPENNAYRSCIDGAAKIDDIAKCNGM